MAKNRQKVWIRNGGVYLHVLLTKYVCILWDSEWHKKSQVPE
jgi:hypothetical protein